uniref:tape measure protein n=1 Tax=Streptococcus pluranimalium TaxID=82348 RepID=UPI003F69337E
MADSKTYTVEAILKATDSSFTKTMRGAMAAVTALKGGSKGMSGLFKGGISSALSFGSVMGIASAVTQKGLQAITNSVGGAVDRFDTLNKYPVVMKALGYTAQDVAKSTKLLSDGIDGLPTTLSDITKSAQNFAPLTGNATKAAKAAIALNNAFLASGASVGDTSRGMQQYTQMLATGKVDMMSWRTLMETMPVALNKVAESFGYTGKSAKTDLYEALKSGEVTIEQLNDKFIELNKGQSGFAELAKKNSEGIGTSFSNLKNAVVKNMANMLTAVDKGFGSAGLGSIAKTIDSLKGAINATFESIAPIVTNVTEKVIQAVKDMWEAFKDTGATSAITDAFSQIKLAFENVKQSLRGNGDLFKELGKAIGEIVEWLAQAVSGIADFVSNMKPETIEATAKAIAGVVLAFKGLSVLANLNPFTIIVGAIAGLVLAFGKAYNSSENFRNGVKKALDILREWGTSYCSSSWWICYF